MNLKSGRTFFIFHLLLGVLLLGAAMGRTRQLISVSLPKLREKPIVLGPLYDENTLLSDEELHRVLGRLLPRDVGPLMKINHVDHALRFWGAEATFSEASTISGAEMQRILTDHRRYQEIYGAEIAGKKPLLIAVENNGVNVRMQEGDTSSSHHDHTLACLAEVGTPLDAPLFVLRPTRPSMLQRLAAKSGLSSPATPIVETTYRAMLEQSIRNFSLNQVEYEWSALAYALYFESPEGWRTTEGQEVDFNCLARRILREAAGRGVCFGNHRLYTLVVLLRIDELKPSGSPLLDEATREEIVAYLANTTRQLIANQHPSGCWNMDWPLVKPGDVPTEVEGDRLSDRILATGHALEWWAMIPKSMRERVHPPHKTLVDACRYLVQTVDGLSDAKIQENFTFLTHAGRALALWRGIAPGEEMAKKAQKTTTTGN